MIELPNSISRLPLGQYLEQNPSTPSGFKNSGYNNLLQVVLDEDTPVGVAVDDSQLALDFISARTCDGYILAERVVDNESALEEEIDKIKKAVLAALEDCSCLQDKRLEKLFSIFDLTSRALERNKSKSLSMRDQLRNKAEEVKTSSPLSEKLNTMIRSAHSLRGTLELVEWAVKAEKKAADEKIQEVESYQAVEEAVARALTAEEIGLFSKQVDQSKVEIRQIVEIILEEERGREEKLISNIEILAKKIVRAADAKEIETKKIQIEAVSRGIIGNALKVHKEAKEVLERKVNLSKELIQEGYSIHTLISELQKMERVATVLEDPQSVLDDSSKKGSLFPKGVRDFIKYKKRLEKVLLSQ